MPANIGKGCENLAIIIIRVGINTADVQGSKTSKQEHNQGTACTIKDLNNGASFLADTLVFGRELGVRIFPRRQLTDTKLR